MACQNVPVVSRLRASIRSISCLAAGVGVVGAVSLGHVGPHVARMQDGDGDPGATQIARQRHAGGVERRLRHAIAVVAARAVVSDGAHAAGDERQLAAAADVFAQRLDHPQWTERVDLELRADVVEIDAVQVVLAKDAGVADQLVEHDPLQALGQGGDPVVGGDVDAQLHPRAERVEGRRRAATGGDDLPPEGLEPLAKGEADARLAPTTKALRVDEGLMRPSLARARGDRLRSGRRRRVVRNGVREEAPQLFLRPAVAVVVGVGVVEIKGGVSGSGLGAMFFTQSRHCFSVKLASLPNEHERLRRIRGVLVVVIRPRSCTLARIRRM